VNKDRASNQSCPLRNPNKAVHFVQSGCVHHATKWTKTRRQPKQKDRRCWHQSRPLRYTCQSTRKQEGSSQSISLKRNCSTSARYVQPCQHNVQNGPIRIDLTQTKGPRLLEPVETSSVYTCRSARKQEGRSRSITSMRNPNNAVRFVQLGVHWPN
jgi:hypothetical protein